MGFFFFLVQNGNMVDNFFIERGLFSLGFLFLIFINLRF